MSEKVKEWTAKRGQAKGIITRVVSFVDGINKDTKQNEVSTRLDLLERAFIEFKEADSKLASLDCTSEMMDIEAKYLLVKTFLNQSCEEPHFTARLPRLHIPTFNGEYKDFQGFKDLYSASVHNKTYLSDAEKFQYLRSCLRGEPAELIQHFTISEANYKAAWSKICDRYDKKKIAVSHFIQTFLDIPVIRERSARKLRSLHNTADQVVRGLEALGPEAESRDRWLLHILLSKTDFQTQQAWALANADAEFPTFEKFLKFVENRCDGLEPCEPLKQNYNKPPPPRSHNIVPANGNRLNTNIRPCILCNELHKLLECEKFLNLDSQSKRNEVVKLNLCFNCLSPTHSVNRCQSKTSCMKCGRRHHSTIHDAIIANSFSKSQSTVNVQNSKSSENSNKSPTTANISTLNQEETNDISAKTNLACMGYAILPTAIVNATDKFGNTQTCNALLDSGSQISFISESCIKRLRLQRQKCNIMVGGLATSDTSTRGKTTIEIHSRHNNSSTLRLNVYILSKITTTSQYDHRKIQYADEFEKLQLADPNYYQQKDIDLLIGADYFFYVLKPNKLVLSPTAPIAQETSLGWVISGCMQEAPINQVQSLHGAQVKIQDDIALETILRTFWEQEEIISTQLWTDEEHQCEKHFKATTIRNQSGRVIVKLLFKDNVPPLGNTLAAAKQRLVAMERKMSLNPEFGQRYQQFIQEYQSLGHMVKLSSHDLETPQQEVCYLPHHGVWKYNSETTKLRVVFDGSCKSSNGMSLNDKLTIGPTVQPSLWTVLLRFRRFPVALCADIEKMYRQILVDPCQTKYQRILWRESTTKPIEHFELKTVTYGTSSASFLATRVLMLIAEENEKHFPEVAHVINQNFYVDDVLTGANNEAEAIQLKGDLLTVLQNYGLPLRKWRSNVQGLRDQTESITIAAEPDNFPVLGLLWNPVEDVFHFNVAIPTEKICTKRSVLSIISRLFDPLGWVSPFVIKTKLMMQRLWLAKVTWDENLPEELQTLWQAIKLQFEEIKLIKIPRFVSPTSSKIEMHGFSDASEVSYAACVYLRVITENKATTNLLVSKTKVAPIQPVSLPRLELCGAHLLAKLITKVYEAFEFSNIPIYLWTDSTVVLSWLKSGLPKKWKIYVANRVAEIHRLVPTATWRHVSGQENPSDLATRGINPSKLSSSELWWRGPIWLNNEQIPLPNQIDVPETTYERRQNAVGLQLDVSKCDNVIEDMLNRISQWTKLLRVIAMIMKFVSKLRNPKVKQTEWITTDELKNAEIVIIKYIQQMGFPEEIKILQKNKELSSKSSLITLSPFIDEYGMLRVGGRLKNASCTYNTKHPLIIPKNHKIGTMILKYLHAKYLHPGPSLLISLSRMKYWILGLRRTARSVWRKCFTCFRYSSHTSSQLMGNLPSQRVIPARPFSKTGVDYAGPIMLASKRGRGAKLVKGYLVIFVCLCTKALHLEVAGDMTTSTFMGALRRFASRRGVPNELISDNGSNFRGAKTVLSDIYRLFQSNEWKTALHQYAADNQIKWTFIPPLAPNFGGIWERAVRSIKSHLVKVIGNSHLTYEEMNTVLTQIESILNSRPLCAINIDDPDDIEALTPAHFLIMGTTALIPDQNYTTIQQSRLTRWQQVQQLVQSYWKRYSRDYLHTLQQRTTVKKSYRNFKVNDVVLLKDDDAPPGSWPLGKIINTHPGTDGLVRVVTVKTNRFTYKRPISKVILLPLDDEDNNCDSLKTVGFNDGEYVEDQIS